jgi:peptidoglycan hydrolase-like protein with peptidoglycan-binding domain
LVVTAAAVFVLGVASPALASTSGAEAQSSVRPADLLPDASWHGRPIQDPDAAPIEVRRTVASTVVGQGAGFGHSGGSDAVRDIQRRLLALGYQPGPVDGAFGPRTRSSVAWFQLKHRLPATGAVDGTTLTALRSRTPAVASFTVPTSSPTVAAEPEPAPVAAPPRPEAEFPPARRPEPAPMQAAPRPDAARAAPDVPLSLLALALGLALAAVMLRRIPRKRAQAMRVPARSSVPGRGRSPGAVAAKTDRPAIGYASGRSERDFARQQRAIARACGERGWKLSAVVKERDEGDRERRPRSGRSHVLAQVAEGGVGQLIVGRLGALAASPAELAAVLDACRRRGVGLLALDVGLDTTSPDGQVSAHCLGAVAAGSTAASATR